MKKILFSLMLMMVSCNIFAQLVEHQDGTVTIQRPTSNMQCILGVGANTYPYNSFKMAINAKSVMSTGTWNVGIMGEGHSPNALNSGRSFGLYGIAGNSTSGFNYGVVGVRHGEQDGAAIYGSINNQIVYIPGVYAGYFKGDTYVNGDLTATNVITPSDIRLKKNIEPLSEINSALDNVLSMNVISYNYKEEEIAEVELDTLQANNLAVRTAENAQKAKDVHFGLSAQELQEIYPNLVKEGQNGYLGVNYVELVPVLIRSIQELKDEIDALRKESEQPEARSLSAICNDGATNIRFSLPDKTTAASICIYDLQGKMLKQIPVASGMTSVTAYSQELGNGIFLCSLNANGKEIETKRIVISK